jgi:hypothetical protein
MWRAMMRIGSAIVQPTLRNIASSEHMASMLPTLSVGRFASAPSRWTWQTSTGCSCRRINMCGRRNFRRNVLLVSDLSSPEKQLQH